MNKTLRDYTYFPKPRENQYPVSFVSPAFAELLKDRVKGITLKDDEYTAFLRNYDQVLPYNWDKKLFRGVKIIRESK